MIAYTPDEARRALAVLDYVRGDPLTTIAARWNLTVNQVNRAIYQSGCPKRSINWSYSPETIARIRELRAEGAGRKQIAIALGLKASQVDRVLSGRVAE